MARSEMRRVYRQLPVDLSLCVPQLKFGLAAIVNRKPRGSISRFVFRGGRTVYGRMIMSSMNVHRRANEREDSVNAGILRSANCNFSVIYDNLDRHGESAFRV